MGVNKDVLNKQREHWQATFENCPDMFGLEGSYAAKKAAKLFKKEGKEKILELGGGQGRDALFFGQSDFQVDVLDYCESGLEAIEEKSKKMALSHKIKTKCHDVRKPLPFKDNTFDACYSHMLFCMALTTDELEFLSSEIRRVLKPKGINIYTVRTTKDAHYRTGIHRGEDIYEVGDFVVHFFSEDKVNNLSKGYKIVDIDEFEEGELPRKLYCVVLEKE